MRILTLIIVTLLAVPAFAKCPTAADLKTGIRFDLKRGDWDVYRRISSDVVEVQYFTNGIDRGRQKFIHGVYTLELRPDSQSEIAMFSWSYPYENADLPLPKENTTWNEFIDARADNRKHKEIHRFTFGERSTHTFGACDYEVIPVQLNNEMTHINSTQMQSYLYIPALGVSPLVRFISGSSDERIEYTGISILPN